MSKLGVEELLPLARISKTQGLKGEFRARPLSGESENLGRLKDIYVGNEEGAFRCYSVERVRQREPGLYILKLAGVDSVEAAQRLVGSTLLAPRAVLSPLGQGDYYWYELEGLRVIRADGSEMGVVESLFATGANDVLVVRSGDRTRYLPYTDAAIREVNTEEKTIRLCDFPGLEEL